MRNTKRWFPINQDRGELQIRGVGIEESMDYPLVDRPGGTGDVLIMFFLQPMICGTPSARHFIDTPSLIWWDSSMGHYYESDQDIWGHSWVHFSGKEEICSLFRIQAAVPQPFDPALAEPWLQMLLNERENPSPDPLIISSLIESFIRSINRETADTTISLNPMGEVNRFLRDNYRKKLTLSMIGDHCNLSISRLCTLYKENYHISIMSDLRRIRVEAALHHLCNIRYSITEVGELSGWPDLYQFSRQFKIVTGVSPREKRKELLKNEQLD